MKKCPFWKLYYHLCYIWRSCWYLALFCALPVSGNWHLTNDRPNCLLTWKCQIPSHLTEKQQYIIQYIDRYYISMKFSRNKWCIHVMILVSAHFFEISYKRKKKNLLLKESWWQHCNNSTRYMLGGSNKSKQVATLRNSINIKRCQIFNSEIKTRIVNLSRLFLNNSQNRSR